jgi:hypothetical protein
MKIVLIHIGKTGGRFIKTKLTNNYDKNFKQYHCRFNKYLTDNEQYIIWVRNPISRFVSAFNYIKTIINLKRDDLTDEQKANKNVKHLFTLKEVSDGYNPRYKKFINIFGSANNLAESLFSSDPEIAKMVKIIMNTESFNHLKCGIGWYLYNGNFVKEHNDKIYFVGRQENMDEDFINLCKKLNINCKKIDEKINENILSKPEDKYLSEFAIKNIIKWYKDTDYAALIELEKHGWITQETLNSYYKY